MALICCSGVVLYLMLYYLFLLVNNDNELFAGTHADVEYITYYYFILLRLSCLGLILGVLNDYKTILNVG